MADVEYGTMPEASETADPPKRRSSHVFVSHEESYEQLNGIAPASVHNDFIKKVYALLAAQLLYTAAICALMMFVPAIRVGVLSFAMNYPNVLQICLLVGLLGSIFWVQAVKNRYPQNMIACTVFVTVMSLDVGIVCAIYYAAGAGNLILLSVLITAAMFLGLSAYAWLSTSDFSYMGGFLLAALLGLIVLGIVQIFLQLKWLSILYCVLGILIFSGYIIYDTYLIKTKLGPDDAMAASIAINLHIIWTVINLAIIGWLYLDIINLFLLILQLLGNSRR